MVDWATQVRIVHGLVRYTQNTISPVSGGDVDELKLAATTDADGDDVVGDDEEDVDEDDGDEGEGAFEEEEEEAVKVGWAR
jgi:hypothetical protein